MFSSFSSFKFESFPTFPPGSALLSRIMLALIAWRTCSHSSSSPILAACVWHRRRTTTATTRYEGKKLWTHEKIIAKYSKTWAFVACWECSLFEPDSNDSNVTVPDQFPPAPPSIRCSSARKSRCRWDGKIPGGWIFPHKLRITLVPLYIRGSQLVC